MDTNIYPIPLGFDRCYLIQNEGVIMVDGGPPNRANVFAKAIEQIAIEPEDIGLIILTHGHWDHIGSAREIKEITGAKIALHAREKDWLEKSLKTVPPGVTLWGHIFGNLMKMFMPLVHIPATRVDLVLGDEELPLTEYGIPGAVLYTPGHSVGSVSVLLETGDAFVGDLAMNMFPLRLGPGLPIFAEDLQKVKDSWELLLDKGAKKIYPAHGNPFSAEIIRQVLPTLSI